jgi:hypothetical protein
MHEIAYLSWGMIPVDENPTTGETTSSNPPMLPPMALDKNVSLVFQLSSAPDKISVELEVTSLSAGAVGDPPLELFTGSTSNLYRALTAGAWNRDAAGLTVTCSTEISGVGSFMKIHRPDDPSLVINRITFFTP